MNKEVIVEIGEFCNKIVTDDKGVWLHFDRELLEEVIDMFEKIRVRGTSDG